MHKTHFSFLKLYDKLFFDKKTLFHVFKIATNCFVSVLNQFKIRKKNSIEKMLLHLQS